MFRRRLAETIAWSNAHLTPEAVAKWQEPDRTGFFAKRAFAVEEGTELLRSPFPRPPSFQEISDVNERIDRVERVAATRAEWLREQNQYPASPSVGLNGGRLLAYDPDGNLFDGAAQAETGGFFDVDNRPPWDLWVCYMCDPECDPEHWTPYSSFLVSWIPPELVEVAGAGVWVNPEECIMWAEDLDTPFTRQLYAEGLLSRSPSGD
jgi:hypothetical protein